MSGVNQGPGTLPEITPAWQAHRAEVPELCHRRLRRSASEYGRLCQGDGSHEEGQRTGER
jgi:hypothetical protein